MNQSYNLVSLLDMLKIGAGALTRAMHAIGMMRGANQGVDAAGSSISGIPIDASYIEFIRDQLNSLKPEATALGADITVISIDRLDRKLKEDSDFHYGDLEITLESIESRLFDEIETKNVFVIDAKHTKYFNLSDLPIDISSKFPIASYDLDEAGKCLAFSRSTAAVFHLMRVMEIALRAVNTCLGASDSLSGNDRNWGNILKSIRDARTAKGRNWNETDLFAEIYALLDATKDAWRNSTMHVDKKYTEEEAEQIFSVVTSFMKKIASRMDEQGCPPV